MPKNTYTEFQCSKCGKWADETTLIKRGKAEHNYRKAMEFGGNPLDWEETHKCCGVKWKFTNSNC
jgi:hypothetical protein